MSVGVNAKMAPAAPEAAQAASPDQGGGAADAFAQLLSGLAGAAAPTSPDAGAVIVPGTPGAEETPADGSAGILPAAKATEDAKAKPEGAEQDPIGSCLIDIAGLIGRLQARRPSGAVPEKKGDAKTDETASDDDGDAQPEASPDKPTASDPADILRMGMIAVNLPAALTSKAMTEDAPMPGKPATPDATVAAAAPQLPAVAEPAAPAATTQPEAAPQADTGAKPAAAADLAKLLEPVKPFRLPDAADKAIRNDSAKTAPPVVPQAQTASQPATPAPKAEDRPVESAASPASTPAAPLAQPPPQPGAFVQPLAQSQPGFADVAAPQDAPAADKMQVVVDRQLDVARDAQWLDRLAKDIAATAGQEGSLRFKLNPETLGTLHVEVAQSHAGTTVRMTADTESARSIIADAQPRLVAEARAQGVRIAETQVNLGSSHQQADHRRHDDGRQEGFLRTASAAKVDAEQPQNEAPASAERFA